MPNEQVRQEVVFVKIRCGKGKRSKVLYGQIRHAHTGELMVSATIGYMAEVAAERGYVIKQVSQSPDLSADDQQKTLKMLSMHVALVAPTRQRLARR